MNYTDSVLSYSWKTRDLIGLPNTKDADLDRAENSALHLGLNRDIMGSADSLLICGGAFLNANIVSLSPTVP